MNLSHLPQLEKGHIHEEVTFSKSIETITDSLKKRTQTKHETICIFKNNYKNAIYYINRKTLKSCQLTKSRELRKNCVLRYLKVHSKCNQAERSELSFR